MQRYGNLKGNSGVTAFELRPRSIVVQFQDGAQYEYTDLSAGMDSVRTMQQLAVAGRGLSTYISQRVRASYAHKIR